MTENNKQDKIARPKPGRAFLSSFHNIKLPSLKEHLIFWPLTTLGVVLDLWSKQAVFDWLIEKQTSAVPIIDGFFRLVMVHNDGAAFGIAAGQRNILIAFSIIAMIVIIGIFFLGGIKSKLVNIALGLFMAGICGNLYDRVFNHGQVRDFLDIIYWPGKHWPAFNIADSMLCVGVGLLIIYTLVTDKPCRERDQQHK